MTLSESAELRSEATLLVTDGAGQIVGTTI